MSKAKVRKKLRKKLRKKPRKKPRKKLAPERIVPPIAVDLFTGWR